MSPTWQDTPRPTTPNATELYDLGHFPVRKISAHEAGLRGAAKPVDSMDMACDPHFAHSDPFATANRSPSQHVLARPWASSVHCGLNTGRTTL